MKTSSQKVKKNIERLYNDENRQKYITGNETIKQDRPLQRCRKTVKQIEETITGQQNL